MWWKTNYGAKWGKTDKNIIHDNADMKKNNENDDIDDDFD